MVVDLTARQVIRHFCGSGRLDLYRIFPLPVGGFSSVFEVRTIRPFPRTTCSDSHPDRGRTLLAWRRAGLNVFDFHLRRLGEESMQRQAARGSKKKSGWNFMNPHCGNDVAEERDIRSLGVTR